MIKDNFENIVNDHNLKIFNYILKIVRNREEAEDLLQEVFHSFWEKMDQVNEKTYLAYLYKTSYHKSLNRIKKMKRSKEKPLQEIVQQAETKIDDNSNEDLNRLIEKALGILKQKESMLIDMQFYQKLSYKEIAEQLGLSISAVDSRLFRAKQKLKKIIVQEKDNFNVLNY